MLLVCENGHKKKLKLFSNIKAFFEHCPPPFFCYFFEEVLVCTCPNKFHIGTLGLVLCPCYFFAGGITPTYHRNVRKGPLF